MSTPSSLAGLSTFDGLNIAYESAYQHNPFKRACIESAIALLPPSARVLDVGCGTGIPVSQMLSTAGLDVSGFDISPKMVAYASSRVKGTFVVSDMLTYQPSGLFGGVFMIFSTLQLTYGDFHAALNKYTRLIAPSGLLVIGQMPGDSYVKDFDWDATRTYVEDYPAPFMGEMLPTLMLSRQGQRDMLKGMGLEIVWETVDAFQPDDEKCVPEEQQYIIARRMGEKEVREPEPTPERKS